jgi:hypothetical protein
MRPLSRCAHQPGQKPSPFWAPGADFAPAWLGEKREEAEEAPAGRYGAAQFLADTEIHDTAGESIAAAPPILLPDQSGASPSLAPAGKPAEAALALDSSGEAAAARPPVTWLGEKREESK